MKIFDESVMQSIKTGGMILLVAAVVMAFLTAVQVLFNPGALSRDLSSLLRNSEETVYTEEEKYDILAETKASSEGTEEMTIEEKADILSSLSGE
jgi:hypothetical protein